MNDQILTLRDLIAHWRNKVEELDKDLYDPEVASASSAIDDCVNDLEALVEQQLVIHVTEGLEPDDADFIYRHVIGRKPEEMP